ncbi:MAG: hypothetical protein JWR04_1210 [Rhodoglobus sp.]|nr:hypothetical protein [Rhodoglobus sp.]
MFAANPEAWLKLFHQEHKELIDAARQARTPKRAPRPQPSAAPIRELACC